MRQVFLIDSLSALRQFLRKGSAMRETESRLDGQLQALPTPDPVMLRGHRSFLGFHD
jgi:hypothetical protein